MNDNPVSILVLLRHAASRGGARFMGQNHEPLSAARRKHFANDSGMRGRNIFRLAADPCGMNVVENIGPGVMGGA